MRPQTNSIVFVHRGWTTAPSCDDFIAPFEAAGSPIHFQRRGFIGPTSDGAALTRRRPLATSHRDKIERAANHRAPAAFTAEWGWPDTAYSRS